MEQNPLNMMTPSSWLPSNKTVFVIDTYSRHEDNSGVRMRYCINDIWYCIREVELEWGEPLVPIRIDDNLDRRWYYVYENYDDAIEFVNTMKRMNR